MRLGRIMGITLQLHYSWFIIFALITFLFTRGLTEDYSFLVSLAIGLTASVLLFASVLAHELAHSLVAIRNGIPVESITLFFLGGVARITREAARPRTEVAIAAAGPMCSLALGIIFGAVWFLTASFAELTPPVESVIFFLAAANIILALFNLIPGFPLDGGRILRAILWYTTKNYRKASLVASTVGQVFGWVLMGLGVILVIASILVLSEYLDPLNGIWLVILGWFLSSLAAASYRQAEMREALKGVSAMSLMDRDYVAVPPAISLRELVDSYVLTGRRSQFMVTVNDELQGVVTLNNIKSVPQGRWSLVTASTVMTPAAKVISARPEDEAVSVLERMEEHRMSEIPVLNGKFILGTIIREKLLHLMRLRTQLKV